MASSTADCAQDGCHRRNGQNSWPILSYSTGVYFECHREESAQYATNVWVTVIMSVSVQWRNCSVLGATSVPSTIAVTVAKFVTCTTMRQTGLAMLVQELSRSWNAQLVTPSPLVQELSWGWYYTACHSITTGARVITRLESTACHSITTGARVITRLECTACHSITTGARVNTRLECTACHSITTGARVIMRLEYTACH